MVGSPALAGLDRKALLNFRISLGFPRTRGDRPLNLIARH